MTFDGSGENLEKPAFTEAEYYSRQIRLPEIGGAGQDKLRTARVLVVGAGGLGCPVLSYLSAAGVGKIGICETDRLEASNLHRQTLYAYTDVGAGKTAAAARRISQQNPFIKVVEHDGGFTPENALALLAGYDLVLDCTDNFAAKFLINDAAVITGTPAIFASIYRYEGQLFAVHPGTGGPCMRCLWPDMPEQDCVGSCADVGVLGAVPGILGAMQAMEAIKHVTGLPGVLDGALVLFDCLAHATQRVKVPRNPACPVCGAAPRITRVIREEYLPPDDLEIDPAELRPDQLQAYRVIDIREEIEVEMQPLPGIAHDVIPMSGWNLETPPIERNEACLLCCAHGIRSARLAEALRGRGYPRVYSVKRGVAAFNIRRSP